jgi:hypothetical protein
MAQQSGSLTGLQPQMRFAGQRGKHLRQGVFARNPFSALSRSRNCRMRVAAIRADESQ